MHAGAIFRSLHLTVRYLTQQLAVNTCPNALIMCGLVTDAIFSQILDKCLQPVVASKIEQLDMIPSEDGAEVSRNVSGEFNVT